jgi:AdoMet-dependent heme synthase
MRGIERLKSLMRTGDNLFRTASFDRLGLVPRSPLMVYVELTRRCNMRCRHCDIWQTAREHEDLEAQEVPGEFLVETLAGQVARGLLAVDLFGGEPLVRTDVVEIVDGLKRAGLHVTITTNGTLLTDELSAGLVGAGLDQLLVSIDGPTAAIHDSIRGRKGTFLRAVDRLSAFHRLSQGKVRLGINTLVCRENIGDLPAMVDFAVSVGAGQVRLLPYHQCYPFNLYTQDDDLMPRPDDMGELGRSVDGFVAAAQRAGLSTNGHSYLLGIREWYEGQRTEVRCSAGLAVCDINAFGEVFPCYTLGKSVGNIRNLPLDRIWRSRAMEQHRRDSRHCRACWQSCYIEPGLRLSPRALLQDRQAVLNDLLEYFLK